MFITIQELMYYSLLGKASFKMFLPTPTDLTLKMVPVQYTISTMSVAELVSIVTASSVVTLLALNLLSALCTMRSLNLFTDKVSTVGSVYTINQCNASSFNFKLWVFLNNG